MDNKIFNNMEISDKLNYLNKAINTNTQTKKLNIPNKVNTKSNNRAFNVVMKNSLVEKLDKICRLKGGYSRNELINFMCDFCINNMDD